MLRPRHRSLARTRPGGAGGGGGPGSSSGSDARSSPPALRPLHPGLQSRRPAGPAPGAFSPSLPQRPEALLIPGAAGGRLSRLPVFTSRLLRLSAPAAPRAPSQARAEVAACDAHWVGPRVVRSLESCSGAPTPSPRLPRLLSPGKRQGRGEDTPPTSSDTLGCVPFAKGPRRPGRGRLCCRHGACSPGTPCLRQEFQSSLGGGDAAVTLRTHCLKQKASRFTERRPAVGGRRQGCAETAGSGRLCKGPGGRRGRTRRRRLGLGAGPGPRCRSWDTGSP